MAITELRISGVRGVVHIVLGPIIPSNGEGAFMLTFELYMVVVGGGFIIN